MEEKNLFSISIFGKIKNIWILNREGVSGEARGATAPHRYLEHALTHIKLAKQMDTKFIEKGHQTMYFHKKQIK